MSVKETNEAVPKLKRPRFYGHRLKDSAIGGVSDVFSADWIYTVFDPPQELDAANISAIHESWKVVGACMRSSMRRYSKMTGIMPPARKDT